MHRADCPYARPGSSSALGGSPNQLGVPMFLRMPWVEVQVSLREQGLAADLEVVAPLNLDVTVQLGNALARVQARVWSHCVVQTSQRVFARARVTNDDGSRISHARAGQLLDVVRTALRSAGGGAAPGQTRGSGSYAVVRTSDRTPARDALELGGVSAALSSMYSNASSSPLTTSPPVA
jgi:hypothetical protein